MDPKLDQNPCGNAGIAESVGALPASPKGINKARQPKTAEINRQGPNGPVRGEVLVVQNAEVFRHFLILAHGVGHAGAGVDAGKRGADQRQEYGDGLKQHERSAMPWPEQRIAHDDHHVADGRRGARGALHGIAAIEEVVRGEILKQIAEHPCTSSETMTAMGTSRLAFLASPPKAVTDSNPTRIRIATVAWTKAHPILWIPTTDLAFSCDRKLPLASLSG